MNKHSPLVSVIIPVYNGEQYLALTLNSVFAQDYRSIEVIVVDDGSTDSTPKIVSAFPAVRLLRQPNSGVSAARNKGVAVASGDFVAFLDADDMWATNKISTHVDYHRKHTDIGYSVSGLRNFLSDGIQPPKWLPPSDLDKDRVGYLPGNLFVLREILDKVGGFDPNFRVGEGADWFARAKDTGISMAILPETLLYRRVHNDNQTHDLEQVRTGVFRALKASIDRQREKIPSKKEESAP